MSEPTLINVTNFPPGGYRYREVALNWEVPHDLAMIGFDDVVRAIQMVRAQNPASNLDPSYSACAEALRTYTCARLKYDPRWCGLPPAEMQIINSRAEARVGRRCASCG